jgi:hypothetical protein
MELPEDGADEAETVRVLVKQHNLVYEKWSIKRWFDEDRKL